MRSWTLKVGNRRNSSPAGPLTRSPAQSASLRNYDHGSLWLLALRFSFLGERQPSFFGALDLFLDGTQLRA